MFATNAFPDPDGVSTLSITVGVGRRSPLPGPAMPTYAHLWSAAAAAGAAVGLSAAYVLSGFVVTAVPLVFVVSLATFVRWGRVDRPAPDLLSATWDGAATGVAVIGSLGLGVWLGPSGFVAALVMAALSPRAIDALTARAWRLGPSTERRVSQAPSLAEHPLRAGARAAWTSRLTNSDLCDGWCASYLALHTARSTEQKIRIVLVRKDYLDEIEARNGPAFRRWLANDPRASSSPAKLLAEPGAEPDDEET